MGFNPHLAMKRALELKCILCPHCMKYRRVKKTENLCARCKKDALWQDKVNQVKMKGEVKEPVRLDMRRHQDFLWLRYCLAFVDAYGLFFLFGFWTLLVLSVGFFKS